MNVGRDVGACEQPLPTGPAEELASGEFRSEPGINSLGNRRPLHAITHFAVLAGFLLPFALIPYLAARRQLGVLRRRMIDVETRVGVLEGDVTRMLSHLSAQRNEQKRLQVLIHELVQEKDGLRKQVERQAVERQGTEQEIRQGLHSLLEESQHTWTQGAALRALGRSLADVAGFMHEVELEMGLKAQGGDKRGVERLRLLALRMEHLPQQKVIRDKGVGAQADGDADGRAVI